MSSIFSDEYSVHFHHYILQVLFFLFLPVLFRVFVFFFLFFAATDLSVDYLSLNFSTHESSHYVC